jgi:hypothetical protein
MHQASIVNINQFHDSNRKVTPTKDSFRNQRQLNSQPRSTSRSQCFRCGRKHNPDTCPVKEWECFFCKVKGHTSKMCKGRRKKYVNNIFKEFFCKGEQKGEVKVIQSAFKTTNASQQSVARSRIRYQC